MSANAGDVESGEAQALLPNEATTEAGEGATTDTLSSLSEEEDQLRTDKCNQRVCNDNILAIFKAHTKLAPQNSVSTNKMVSVVGLKNIIDVCPIIKVLYDFAVPRDYLQIALPYNLHLFKIIMFITSLKDSLQNTVITYNYMHPMGMGSMYDINLKNLVVIKKKLDELSDSEFTECLKLATFMQHTFAEKVISRVFIHRVLGLSHNLTTLRTIFNIKDLAPNTTKLYSKVAVKYESLVFNSSYPVKFKKLHQSEDVANNSIKWIFNNGFGELQCNSFCETLEIERMTNFPIQKIECKSKLNRVIKK